jgi:serine/threonine protein kinase/membrane protein implicated in regulation of membrane protease activity
MKRIVIIGVFLFVFSLAAVAAATVERTSILMLAGVFLIVSTVVAADLVSTGLRRRARRTALPVPPPPRETGVEKTAQPFEEKEVVLVEPEEELWLPPLPEAGEDLWVVPSLPEGEGPREMAPPPTTTTDLVGQVIGPYQILEKIGQGGMATVYRGFHAELDRQVAIKVLAGALPTTPELVQRFQREARTIAALRHPNVVQVYDFGPLGDTYYLAMEYVEGSDLAAEMRRRREEEQPFSPNEILHLLSQVAEALDYAHAQGVIHRDVKPGNVLMTPASQAGSLGQPILTDFGLATLRRTRATLITTIGQNVLGTPEYTAPEQALDAQAANSQSDIYSLGCILYELVTDHLPFEGDSALSIALMVISSDPMPPRAHVPDLPAAVERVILCALDKEPKRRFVTARAMVEALRRAWEGET